MFKPQKKKIEYVFQKHINMLRLHSIWMTLYIYLLYIQLVCVVSSYDEWRRRHAGHFVCEEPGKTYHTSEHSVSFLQDRNNNNNNNGIIPVLYVMRFISMYNMTCNSPRTSLPDNLFNISAFRISVYDSETKKTHTHTVYIIIKFYTVSYYIYTHNVCVCVWVPLARERRYHYVTALGP